MLWLVPSLVLMSMFCPAMTPTTRGLYMQPFWSSWTAVVGTCQVLSGRPDLTQTNAYFNVPLSLTMTSSAFCPLGCAFVQKGTADISRAFGVGLAPSKITLPVIVPPLASSGVAAAPPAAGAGVPLSAVLGASDPPQLTMVTAHTTPIPIQIFFML